MTTAECDILFTPSPLIDTGSFKLMELPPDLCKFIETATSPSSFTIKGQANEDAVLCTSDKTYAIRSVVLSNSVLVVTAADSDSDESMELGDNNVSGNIVIRDQLNEILELVPSVPRLHKLNGLLRGAEYDEGREDIEDSSEGEDGRPRKKQKMTLQDAQTTLQASDVELVRGLKNRRVLVLKGALRPIAPSHLTTILELLLTYLVSLSQSHQAASIQELCLALEDGHEIGREVTTQVMEWFGTTEDGRWKMDVQAVVKEVGIGILRAHKHDPITQDDFLVKWKSAVGDTFESDVSLPLLAGNYLESVPGSSLLDSPEPTLTYFPSSALPVDPAARFTDLFLTRARWRADDIAPFLADIVVDSKERDKLLLKHARTVTGTDGVWYTARAKYNG